MHASLFGGEQMQKESGQRDAQTYAIIGAAMEVHRELGHGFLEAVYKEALAMELQARGIPFEREVLLTVLYKGVPLTCKYKADFICWGEVIIEAKALSDITGSHRAQTINYLKSTKMKRSLLINFGSPSLHYERLVWNYQSECSDDLSEG
jgi:GxxExxY protein